MRVLLLSAATGGGHIRAAAAVEEYIKANTSFEVKSVDALKAAGKLVDKTISGGYLIMARHMPALFGRLYRKTDKESPLSDILPMFNGQVSRLLLPTIEEFLPDVIVSTHPFVTEMVSQLKGMGLVTCPLICVITDYGPHKAYLAERVDAYIVACSDMVDEMVKRGVSRDKIYPYGIPVLAAFFKPTDKAQARKELGLDTELTTVLFMAGSFGVSNIMELYAGLSSCKTPMQLVVITGKNQKLYDEFSEKLKESEPIPTKLVFFTNEVEKYMAAADLLVTKPGGLTVSEALARNLPLAAFDAIPGQEEDNAEFLERHGMCVRIKPESDFAYEVTSLLNDPIRLSKMERNCRAFDKSACCEKMAALMQRLAEENAK